MIISKKEFARQNEIADADMFKLYKRGKFVYVGDSTGKDAMIDTNEPINASFIHHRKNYLANKRGESIQSPAPPPPKVDTPPVIKSAPSLPPLLPPIASKTLPPPVATDKIKPATDRNEVNASVFNLQQEVKKQELRTKTAKARMDEIALAEMEGRLIPLAPVSMVLSGALIQMAVTFKDEVERQLKLDKVKYDLDSHQVAERRKRFHDGINKSFEDAKSEVKKGLDNIVKENKAELL